MLHSQMSAAIDRKQLANSRPTWFEGAAAAISQLAQSPEQRGFDVMTASLAALLQRLSQVKMQVRA
jgi:hypothetical protein